MLSHCICGLNSYPSCISCVDGVLDVFKYLIKKSYQPESQPLLYNDSQSPVLSNLQATLQKCRCEHFLLMQNIDGESKNEKLDLGHWINFYPSHIDNYRLPSVRHESDSVECQAMESKDFCIADSIELHDAPTESSLEIL